jgi:hypothetical protein
MFGQVAVANSYGEASEAVRGINGAGAAGIVTGLAADAMSIILVSW